MIRPGTIRPARALARAFTPLLAATVVAALAAFAAPAARAQTIDFIPFHPLEPGPGAGFTTFAPPYVRPLRPDVTVHPILTVGDTLLSADPDIPPYVFFPVPDGIGVRQVGNGLVEVCVTHELGWEEGLGGSRVSRLLLDQRSAGVVAADYILDGHEDFRRLCAASLAGTRQGFLSPTFLVNEESIQGPRRGEAAAIDLRNGTLTTLPWLGHYQHEQTVIVPISSGRVAAIGTEDGIPGQSNLYLYLADTDSDFLAGRGQLYVFRADAPPFQPSTRLSSMVSKARPITGRFISIDSPEDVPDAQLAFAFENVSQSVGCLNFVRLEDAAPDDERSDSFYFVDTGDMNVIDPISGQPVTGNGRLYRMTLDPMDPTTVTSLEVVLDGDQGDDLFRPDNIATHENTIMIQEDPGIRGIHPARILRYDTQTRRLDPLAVCAERDQQGRLLPEGTGGLWESSGIVDVSEFFGDDTWMIDVQAHTLRSSPFRGTAGGGQLLLLQGPNAKRPSPPRRSGGKAAKSSKKADDGGAAKGSGD
ncbi:MAG: alkaline phosphatase PhoX [Hyphomicrobiales bacterium]